MPSDSHIWVAFVMSHHSDPNGHGQPAKQNMIGKSPQIDPAQTPFGNTATSFDNQRLKVQHEVQRTCNM